MDQKSLRKYQMNSYQLFLLRLIEISELSKATQEFIFENCNDNMMVFLQKSVNLLIMENFLLLLNQTIHDQKSEKDSDSEPGSLDISQIGGDSVANVEFHKDFVWNFWDTIYKLTVDKLVIQKVNTLNCVNLL